MPNGRGGGGLEGGVEPIDFVGATATFNYIYYYYYYWL